MSERYRFFLSFRARLVMLWSSFLIITIVFVFAIDRRVESRVNAEVESESKQVKDAVSGGLVDFSRALTLAQEHLSSSTYLYETPKDIPPSIEHIIITDEQGVVKDSTLRDLKYIPVPNHAEGMTLGQPGDPVQGEVKIHGGVTKTYDLPVVTDKGLYWIVIVMQQGTILEKVDATTKDLLDRTRQSSNIGLAATTGLLLITLALLTIFGGRFTRPVKELAGAAHRIAGGDLDFRVDIRGGDEFGQLASTFNEMIAGLKSKRVLEEKLNQAERAAVMGRLTQAIAHEIRNPLNFLNLSIDHLRTKFAPEDSERRSQFQEIAASIKSEIARLNKLVTDVLNYGRLSKLTVRPMVLSDVVKDTLAMITPQANDQGVEVKVQDDGANSLIVGDTERLKSCVANIAINALQAMPGGGSLVATVTKSNGLVRVSIADTGAGMSDDSLHKIFEPYFSTKQEGFGLGLAITRKIIEEHKGSIEVSSRPGAGTTFVLNLPAASEESEQEGE